MDCIKLLIHSYSLISIACLQCLSQSLFSVRRIIYQIYLRVKRIKMQGTLNGRVSSHSMNSQRYSSMSNDLPSNSQLKKMEAEALMNYYKKNSQIKQTRNVVQHSQKQCYGQVQNSLTQNYLLQQEAKRRKKQQIKQKLAQEYDEMIKLKQQKVKEQRKHVLEIQRQNLQNSRWGRDYKVDMERKRKLKEEYGKSLQTHLYLQQLRKHEQKLKERQIVEKYQRQQQKQNIDFDDNKYNQFKKRQSFELRQNQILGINKFNPQTFERTQSLQIQKAGFKEMKRRQQLLYGTGLQHQLKYQMTPIAKEQTNFDKIATTYKPQDRLFSSGGMSPHDLYNPITNPIQRNYKNPYVLRMLSHNV